MPVGAGDLAGQRVAFLVPSSFDYAAAQWGIWRAGGIAVPLCTMLKVTRIEYRPLGQFDEQLASAVGTTLADLRERVRLGNARQVPLDEEMRVIHFCLVAPASTR
mgnify:CR=1 FL=1